MVIERDGDRPQNPSVSREENSAEIPGKGLQIWGEVRFRAEAVIRAGVKGSVVSTEKLIVAEGAVVSGSVEGTDVRVEGEAQGGVVARGQVWIGPKAKVKVRCSGRAVRIEPGAEFRGELQVG